MWRCAQCAKDLDRPQDPCPLCSKPSGVPSNVVRAERDAPHLQERYDKLMASQDSGEALPPCEAAIRGQMDVTINRPPRSLVGLLSDPRYRYLNLHDNLRAGARLDEDRELAAKRTVVDLFLFGPDGDRVAYGALTLGTIGVYSYGNACLHLK